MTDTPLGPAVSSHTEAAIRDVIARSATQGERIIATARMALAALALARSYWVWSYYELRSDAPPVLAQVALVLATAAFSSFVLLRYRHRNAPVQLFTVSVAVDAAICFAALAGNALWPAAGYRGLTFLPDLAAVLIPAAAAGLRLSPGVAIFGGALNFVSLLTLVALDAQHQGPQFSQALVNVSATAALLASITVVAVLSAARAGRLVRAGAEKSLEAERAERNLGEVLRDHHDVRTLLSSASLNADLVLRALQPNALGSRELLDESARQLREDLDRVNEFVANIKERTYTDLLSLRALESAPLAEAAERVSAQLRPRFPEVELALVEDAARASAMIAGGAPALERLLQNLIVNACEGDGQRGATRVEVRVFPASDSKRVRIAVCDDGPGFSPALLRAASGGVATTKRDGSGLGLALVRELVEASGGSLERGNRPEGGAIVSVTLNRASGGPARE